MREEEEGMRDKNERLNERKGKMNERQECQKGRRNERIVFPVAFIDRRQLSETWIETSCREPGI